MDSKHTMLLFRTPASETKVPGDVRVAVLNTASRQLDELLPGADIPAPGGEQQHVYTVPVKPVEAVFAVLGAISCKTPNGGICRPGFCFSVQLRYISPLGLKTLLTASTARNGYVPDCVTLEDLYNIAAPQVKTACEKAADQFSGGSLLTYTHWWQEMTSGTTFARSIATALVPVFNSYGFRLDRESVQIKGLASIPLG